MLKIKFKTLNNNSMLKPLYIGVACIAINLVGCASDIIQSTPEYHNPPAALKEKMKSVMPSYEPWIAEVENKFAMIAEAPNQQDIEWAQRLGIKNINNIRIFKTDYFPMPQDGELLRDLELLDWGSPYEDARNMGYTIFIRNNNDTAQVRAKQIALIYLMENMGRSRFLYRLLVEQRTLDAKDRPLMIQANKLAKCAPNDKGKISFNCTFTGVKPSNHKAMEQAKKQQSQQQKNQEVIQKEIQDLQKDNILEEDLKNIPIHIKQ